MPKTGEWLRKSEAFTQWHEQGKTALWVNGTPGSGKSVVAATLVSDFAKSDDIPVLYFFFRHANLANRNPQQLTRDWLSQLLDHSSLAQLLLKDLLKKHPRPEEVPFDDLWECLRLGASGLPKVYCVADALDEMERGNDWFLHKLISLGRQKPSTLKVVTASRQSPFIEAVFKESAVVNLNLNRRLIEQDIATYVNHLLRDLERLGVTATDRDSIRVAIQAKATGIFLYAKLMMEEVLRGLNVKPLGNLLSTLPVGVNGMYTTLLKEHSIRSGVPHDVQKLILQWVTHSSRPLRLLEVAETIRSTDQGKALGDVQKIKHTIRTACGPLLTILPDETLQVIHHSFTEFLIGDTGDSSAASEESYPIFDSANIHKELAIISISYLLFCAEAEKRTEKERKKQPHTRDFSSVTRDSLLMKHPFLQYATANWMLHTCKARGSDITLTRMIGELFDIDSDAFSYWQCVWRKSVPSAIRTAIVHPIHVTAFFGMTFYIESLCEKDPGCTDLPDSTGRTPLSYACEKGHSRIIELLLENGAKVNSHSTLGIAPIHYVAQTNNPTLVKALLEAGANPLDKTPKPDSDKNKKNYSENSHNRRRFGIHPLQHACKRGYTKNLTEILRFIRPNDIQSGPIHWAAAAGQADTVALLLQTGHIDPNLKDEAGNTPLCLAAHHRSPSTVKVLLEAGADFKGTSNGIDRFQGVSRSYLRSNDNRNTVTPLHAWACKQGTYGSSLQDFIDTGRQLLMAGCDINARDSEGKTPLFHWVKFGHAEWTSAFMQMLLDGGADGGVTDNEGNNPLHKIPRCHTEAQISLLIKAGSDMNARRGTDGQTPLMCQFNGNGYEGNLSEAWHTYVDKYSVDPNAQDLNGRTVLHRLLASAKRDIPKIEYWLRAGADPNIKDARGRNCLFGLSQAYSNGIDAEKNLVSILLAAGLHPNALDHDGRNCGLNAIGHRELEEVNRLESYGVDIKAKDYQGKSALHILAARADSSPTRLVPLMTFLMRHRVDPNAIDFAGNTVAHVAIMNAHHWKFYIDNVIKLGADIAVRNNQGRTVLHLAAATPMESRYDFHNGGGEKRLVYLLHSQWGLDINLPDHQGATALHIAATHDVCSAARLIDAGAEPSAIDNQKRTVLHYAARGGNPNALGFLAERMGKPLRDKIVNAVDSNGRTALHDAVRSGVLESVQILLAANANPNARDSTGKAALHTVSECPEERSLALLQSSCRALSLKEHEIDTSSPFLGWNKYAFHPAGLQPEASSRPGHVPTQVSTEEDPSRLSLEGVSRVKEIVELLLDAGADPHITDDHGKSPYDFAVASNSEEAAFALHSALMKLPSAIETQRTHLRCPMTGIRERLWTLERENVSKAVHGTVTNSDEANSILLSAIRTGDPSMIEELLKCGADPLKPLADGKTVLHIIARNGLLPIMRLLVHSRDVQLLPKDILHEAVQRERPNIEMVKFLVALGLDPNAKTVSSGDYASYHEEQKTVVHLLAAAKYWWHSLALDYLLKLGIDPELQTSKGETVLQLAIKGDSRPYRNHGFWKKSSVDILLKHGVRLNYTDPDGKTPLMHACNYGAETVKLLLSHGADIDLGDNPPIGYAVESYNTEVVEAFLDAGADCNALCQSWPKDSPRRPLLLHIACGAFNSNVSVGESVESRKANAEEIIKLLLRRGANSTMTLADGTPIITAVIRGGGILRPFMSPDSDLEVRDSHDMTPLMAACTCHNSPAIKMLIEAGANLQAVDYQQKTGLHHLCAQSRSYYDDPECESARALVDAGALLDVPDKAGYSPLHYAIRQQSQRLIKVLLDAGADASRPYPEGHQTALHFLLPKCAEDGSGVYRKRKDFVALAKRFIDAGVDREQANQDGNTAIFGYVAVRPTYEEEYWEDNIYPDLEEQRRFLSDYNIHAGNNEGQNLMHVVAKRSRERINALSGRDDTRDMFKILWDMGADPKAEDCEQRTPLDFAAACGNRGVLDLFAPPKEIV